MKDKKEKDKDKEEILGKKKKNDGRDKSSEGKKETGGGKTGKRKKNNGRDKGSEGKEEGKKENGGGDGRRIRVRDIFFYELDIFFEDRGPKGRGLRAGRNRIIHNLLILNLN